MLVNNHDDHENRGRKNWIGEKEKQRLLELHEERARDRQAESDLNLLRAMQLGRALRALKGE